MYFLTSQSLPNTSQHLISLKLIASSPPTYTLLHSLDDDDNDNNDLNFSVVSLLVCKERGKYAHQRVGHLGQEAMKKFL